MSDVGQEIRRLREAKGWGQPKLAVEAGVAVSGVSQIENGRRNPNSSTLVKLAGALGVGVADLFPKAEAPLWSGESPGWRTTASTGRSSLARTVSTTAPSRSSSSQERDGSRYSTLP